MSLLKKIGLPNEVISYLIDELCVAEPTGITLTELWDMLTRKNGEIDEFTKKLTWSWLIKEPDFEVTDNEGKLIDSSTIMKYSDLNGGENYKLKVTDDRRSIFLLGVPFANNSLGSNPYELLRVITKAGKSGIVSKDLAVATGQDIRSFTSRLAVLEDLDAIKKLPITINGMNTNLLINSKYEVDQRSIQQGERGNGLNKLAAAKEIINALKQAPDGIRSPFDLRKELKMDTTKALRRHYHSIVKSLLREGYASLNSVKLVDSKRQFAGLQYVKDLPKDFSLTLLTDSGDDPDSTLETEANLALAEREESPNLETDSPILNRFFLLNSQIFEMIKEAGVNGISSTDIAKRLVGADNARPLLKHIPLLGSDKIVKGPGNYTIIKGQDFEGKIKYFRYIHQPLFLKSKGMNVEPPNDHFTSVDKKSMEMCLAQLSAMTYTSSPIRIAAISFPDNNNCIWWSGYSGVLLNQEAANFKSTSKSHILILDDDSSEIQISSSKKRDLSLKKSVKKLTVKPKEELKDKQETTSDLVITSSNRLPVTAVKEEPKDEDNDVIEITFSNTRDDRLQTLLQFIDKEKITSLDTNLQMKLKDISGTGFLMDRRTVRKDADLLESKGLITKKTVQHPFRLQNIILASSVKNPPTEADEKKYLASLRVEFSKAKNITSLRTFSDKPLVEVKQVHFFGERPITLSSSARLDKKKMPFGEKDLKADRLLESSSIERVGTKNPKRRVKIGDADKDIEVKEEPVDDIDGFIPKKKRKKLQQSKKKAVTSSFTGKKNRKSFKVDIRDTMLILRAVIILQSLSYNNNIDWSAVSSLFDEYKEITAETLKRQWSRIKKDVGSKVLQQTRSSWEKILMKAIQDGEVGRIDLLQVDLHLMLDLWRKLDEPTFESLKNSIYADIDDNYAGHEFKLDHDPQGLELFRDLNSVIEREEFFNKTSFAYPIEENDDEECREKPNEMDGVKIRLKALFATPATKFSSDKAMALLKEIGEDKTKKAISELESLKEIAFLGEDSQIKFTLTDRSMNLLDTKLNDSMLNNASAMYNALEDISLNSKGLILSRMTPDGCYFPIINMIAEDSIKITRIDKDQDDLTLNYSTRQTNKSKFESDFILSGYSKEKIDDESSNIKTVALPIGKPCTRLWIDLRGDLNREIWIKAVLVLLQSIVNRPGTPFKLLVKRLNPLLTPLEVREILDWLVAKNSIRHGNYDGYWALPKWYLVLST